MSTGVRLPYVEYGNATGVPVVFLHAYADSHRFFEPALAHLPDTVHAFLPTQRGHGDAEKPAAGYALRDFSEDVAAFLDAVGLPRAVVVGHSSGGYVAQRFAADHPQRTLGLVLIGSPRSLHDVQAPFGAAVAAMRDPVAASLVREVMGTFPLFHPVPAPFLAEMVHESAKVPARVWQAALAGLTQAVPPTEVTTIHAPTLILWGDRDGFLARADQERMAAALPSSKLIIYPGVGHLVLWEQPERVAADVAAFAETLERRRSRVQD